MEGELNPFKLGYIVMVIINIIFFAMAWTVPSHTNFAEYYAWLMTTGLILIFLDVAIVGKMMKDSKLSEIFDTATIEENNPKYLLQRFKLPFIGILALSVIIGLVWGGYYIQQITLQQKALMFIPNLYSTLPTAGLFGQLANTWDIFSSSIPVALAEETIVSTLFATLLGIGMLITEKIGMPNLQGWAVAALIAIIITAGTFSYAQHAFTPTYQANAPAYEAAFMHSAICCTTIALTGTNLACIISHSIHNWFAKASLNYQQFVVVG